MNAEAGSVGSGAGSSGTGLPGEPGVPEAGGGLAGVAGRPATVPELTVRCRRELRAQRRQRQVLLVWCAAAVVAVLVATVVILGIARDRSLFQRSPPAGAVSAHPTGPVVRAGGQTSPLRGGIGGETQ